MRNYAVIGLQWGDEGKGKIVDILSEKIKMTVRYQGGHNAGHTVIIGDKKIVLHLIPSGIIHKDTIAIIERGVVIDPFEFLKEVKELENMGIKSKGRLFISKDAHLILPYHSYFDELIEEIRGTDKIGTTKRGIGPCYEDKYGRRGIRVSSLLNLEILKEEIEFSVKLKNIFLKGLGKEQINPDKIYSKLMEIRSEIIEYIGDTMVMIKKAHESEKPILFEGAQGSLLDIDYGTYPFVSSSNPTAGGILTGGAAGDISSVKTIGIVKAYATRVGRGAFPTEDTTEKGDILREKGKEFGATTGRPRRCGWIDLFALKYSTYISGVKSIVLTKIDILDSFDKIKVCTGYKYKGEKLDNFPNERWILDKVEPEYIELDGWKTSTSGITEYEKLPENTKKYIEFIENYLKVSAIIISTGPARRETILKEDIF
jgi:adenylosuccinate synthase